MSAYFCRDLIVGEFKEGNQGESYRNLRILYGGQNYTTISSWNAGGIKRKRKGFF